MINSQIATQEKRIDECVYTVTPFTGRKGVRIKTRLLKLIGPSLGYFVDGLSGHDISGQIISEAITKLTMQLDEDQTVNFILELLEKTAKDGKELGDPKVFDLEFAANYGILYKALWFTLEVNFGNFLPEIIGNLTASQKMKISEVLSSKTLAS